MDPLISRHVCVAHGHAMLDFESTTPGVYNAGELYQNPIARRFHDPAAINLDRRIDQFGTKRAEAACCSFLVRAGQP